MCNLSEGVYEKGRINATAEIFKAMMKKGMSFEEIVKLTDVTNETAEQIREYFKKHTS